MRPSLAKVLGTITVATFAAGLVFRFAVYRRLYIAPGDPYGVSDVIELLLGYVLILALGLSVLGALALLVKGPRANRVAAFWLLAVCGAVAALVAPLHDLAAKWAI